MIEQEQVQVQISAVELAELLAEQAVVERMASELPMKPAESFVAELVDHSDRLLLLAHLSRW